MITSLRPQLHVTVRLLAETSFSSQEEPLLEVPITLRYSQPMTIHVRSSCLWPEHLHSTLIANNVSLARGAEGDGKEWNMANGIYIMSAGAKCRFRVVSR